MPEPARPPILVLNAVGLTPRLLPHAPRLAAIAQRGWMRPMHEITPAVTCSAQATLLTGKPVREHGIVANGWLFADTREVRFWQQSNALIQAEPLYVTARRRAQQQGRSFKCAKLFWWFNQGAAVDISVTPKPWYGVDGNKVFGISGTPDGLTQQLERELGPFPFHTFWGPMAGLACTQWIARCAASVLRDHQPDLTLVYLPHLDYDPQRFGPANTDMPHHVRALDEAAAPLLDAAERLGAEVWIVSEYGHSNARRAILPNRALRERGLLTVRDGPFGEQLDTFASRALAVCDHQIAHVYVREAEDVQRVREALAALPGVARSCAGDERAELGLDHPRAGQIVLLPEREAWLAYPFWLDDRRAPDYARTVAIHHKPGFDPAELFFDPALAAPKLRSAIRLAQKKLGFRTRFDVIPLDPSIVRGTHGLPAADPADAAILIGPASIPAPAGATVAMTDFAPLLLSSLG
jgi:hypothetical protein